MDRTSQPPVILIVDDEPDMRILLNHFMHQLAPMYDVITASDAQSALHHVAYRTVPLLITDYLMLGMRNVSSPRETDFNAV